MKRFFTLIFILFSFVYLAAQSKQPNKKVVTKPSNTAVTSTFKKDSPNISNDLATSNNKKKIDITGIWRGYFIQKDFDPLTGTFVEDRYKYEVQINTLANNALEGVTYSYQTTRFYGKSSLQGILTTQTQSILIKELRMLELKVTGFADPCLMTCYLDYSKDGNKEILKGDYTSENARNKKACGEGIVYLEKVPESDFGKEEFLLKKKPLIKSAIPTTPPKNNPLVKSEQSKKEIQLPKEKNTLTKPRFKPGAEDALVKKEDKIKTNIPETKQTTKTAPTPENNSVKDTTKDEQISLPKVLTERKNNLVKTLYVDEGELLIELYDNGEIDNDTVSIYHNGKPVILQGRLSGSPITVKIKVSADDPIHELVMVADNLGEIPPNTSLMVITAGKKTYQLFLTSDLEKNAKIVFEYKPQVDNSKNKK
jgi:hypothetical protein